MLDLDRTDDGEFDRQDAQFRDVVRDDPDARFRPEPGRYHLYVSRACPWAHGVVLVRTLQGLEDAITMDVVDPYREERGWQFTPDKAGCTDDRLHGADYLAEIYDRADPSYDDRPTVPVLWDRKEGTIVNNESIEIMQMLTRAFQTPPGGIELYPPDLRPAIDELVTDLYESVNNAVYRAGFAASQEAYDDAVDDLFETLDRLESRLSDRRFLVGEQLTLADLRLFQTLVRFDEVYHTHFKCNVRRIEEHPALWGFTRDVYGLPGVAETVNVDHVKEHYYRTHDDLNPTGIVPRGPSPDFAASHDRAELPGDVERTDAPRR